MDIDLLDKINRTKVAAGPWSGWPLDKLQTPVRWIAGIISSSLSSSASSSLSSSSLSSPALYCHHCHCHHQHPTETISLIGLPLARLPRIAKTTTPAKTEVRELQRPTMKASLWKTLRGNFEDLIGAGFSLHCGIGIVISGLLKFLQPVTIVGEVIVA